MIEAILFDSETNGREPQEIIEAATLPMKFGNPPLAQYPPKAQRFHPSQPSTLGALAVHGIYDEEISDMEPSAMFEIPEAEFLVGHAVDFDWNAAGSPEGFKRICTCALAREIWPSLDCYSQSALIYHLDRPNARERLKAAHGAAADVLLCKTILDAEIAALGVTSWEALWQASEKARIPKTMPFGKWKNVPIADLEPGYKRWLLAVNDPPICPYLRLAVERTMGGGKPKEKDLFRV